MFLKFSNHDERRSYGGSCFVEIQYCRLPEVCSDQELVSVDSISHWDYSSLYIFDEDLDEFLKEYQDILPATLYNNLEEGSTPDCYGINYYSRSKEETLISRLQAAKPKEYEILLDWLAAEPHNGFYMLGI